MQTMSIPIDSKEAAVSGSDNLAGAEQYLRIGDIARTYGITLRTLRFYEDKGLLEPRREGTTRLYTVQDIKKLQLILLGRKVGFSLREVKQMLDLYSPGGANIKQLRVAVEKGERQLGRLVKQREFLEESIVELQRAIEVSRTKLSERQARQQN
jgi:DNA-binding transcriptional MerR regulator